MFLQSCCGSFAEICGDDESVQNRADKNSISWLAKFPSTVPYRRLTGPYRPGRVAVGAHRGQPQAHGRIRSWTPPSRGRTTMCVYIYIYIYIHTHTTLGIG